MDDFEKNPNEGPESDLSDYVRIVLANIGVVLAITALFAIGSTVHYCRLPNLYTASVQILVERIENTPKSSQEMMLPSFRGEEDYYGTQIAILTGRKISSIVGQELGTVPGFSMSARRLPKTRIIVLSVTSHDPQSAAKVANKYAEVYVREGNREDLFIGQQILKLIPEEMDSKEVEAMQKTGSIGEMPAIENVEGMKDFDKKEYAESLSAITNDPVIAMARKEKLEIEAKISELSQRYKPSHPNIKNLNERLAYVEETFRERTRKILSNIRTSLSGESRIRNVKILEEAYPPSRPSAPNRHQGIMVFTVLGFFSGIAFVIFMERANQKIRTERDFHGVPLPFLGQIPLLPSLASLQKKKMEQKRHTISLVSVLKNDPVLADSIASVRTHILFSMPYEKSRRIMLTSCIPDEGKTTVSALLSVSLTTLGRKILLIDADMRRPFAHNYLDMRNDKGLSDYLIGQASLEEVIRDVPDSTLKVITAGNPSPNPSELVASERFRALLEYGEANFDRIVIDVPPVLFIPDGLIVAKYVHSGVLVCGSGMVHKKTVRTIKDKFESIGHSFIGIVVNKVDFDKTSHRNKYYQSYKSYYAHASRPKAEVPSS